MDNRERSNQVMRSSVSTKEKIVLPGKYIDSIFVPNNIFSI